ncbi:ribosomal RNA small subunit methyltransferase G [Planctomycetota bacterium]|nr:ribosomal RNA small subunit methyltransferase G [Planctomycetota bacterium]
MARRDPVSDDPALGSVDPVHHPPIRFPETEWAWFLGRCAALGITGASERRGVLEAVFGHLVGVNRWLNLTTVVEPRAWLKQHLLDSLSGLADSRLRHLSEGSPCLDLGSGGGYPGIPLALWTPRIPWVLADARRKKAEFLAAAAKVTGLPRLTARHLRGGEAERAAPELHRKCQLVTSRAMGAGDEVLAEAAPLIHHHGHCLLFKGPSWLGAEREAALAAAPRCGFRFVAEREVVLEDGDPPRLLVCFQRV